jgi:hypothetical protein
MSYLVLALVAAAAWGIRERVLRWQVAEVAFELGFAAGLDVGRAELVEGYVPGSHHAAQIDAARKGLQ